MKFKRGDICRLTNVDERRRCVRKEDGSVIQPTAWIDFKGQIVEVLDERRDADNVPGYFVWIPSEQHYGVFHAQHLEKL